MNLDRSTNRIIEGDHVTRFTVYSVVHGNFVRNRLSVHTT